MLLNRRETTNDFNPFFLLSFVSSYYHFRCHFTIIVFGHIGVVPSDPCLESFGI